jgi:hypothetical protein
MPMSRRRLLTDVLVVPLLFAALKLALQAAAILNYGCFRDKIYYIACSKQLAWGYVDQPPLSIGLLAASRALLGDSLVALRTLPALARRPQLSLITEPLPRAAPLRWPGAAVAGSVRAAVRIGPR